MGSSAAGESRLPSTQKHSGTDTVQPQSQGYQRNHSEPLTRPEMIFQASYATALRYKKATGFDPCRILSLPLSINEKTGATICRFYHPSHRYINGIFKIFYHFYIVSLSCSSSSLTSSKSLQQQVYNLATSSFGGTISGTMIVTAPAA